MRAAGFSLVYPDHGMSADTAGGLCQHEILAIVLGGYSTYHTIFTEDDGVENVVLVRNRQGCVPRWVHSLFPTTDFLSWDLCDWSHCQGHRCHQHLSSSDCSDHSEGKDQSERRFYCHKKPLTDNSHADQSIVLLNWWFSVQFAEIVCKPIHEEQQKTFYNLMSFK